MMKKLSDKEIKQILLDILIAFTDFCDAHELRYYLCGGTLLGAVRHKGFIPWDDDIDVFMPRPDYMKMHELLCSNPLTEYYELRSNLLNNSVLPFAKVVDLRTVVKTKFNDLDNILWIDIFPLDGIPSDEKKSADFLNRALMWKKMFGFSISNIGTGTTIFKTFAKIPILLLGHCIGHKVCAKKLDEIARTYDFESSNYIAEVVWTCGASERLDKKEYLPIVDLEFCGRMFHAPACWDKFLTKKFGNYMKLPPKTKQFSHCIDAYKIDK